MSMDQFKHNIRKVMARKGVSAKELALRTNISVVSVYAYLSTKNNCGLNASTLELIADALDVTMDELYRGSCKA